MSGEVRAAAVAAIEDATGNHWRGEWGEWLLRVLDANPTAREALARYLAPTPDALRTALDVPLLAQATCEALGRRQHGGQMPNCMVREGPWTATHLREAAVVAAAYEALVALPPEAPSEPREGLRVCFDGTHVEGCSHAFWPLVSPGIATPPTPTLDAAWQAAEAAVRAHTKGAGFGVAVDGPGYRARVGHEEWHGGYVEAWSVDDPELVGDPDNPSSPAKALLKLAAKLSEASDA